MLANTSEIPGKIRGMSFVSQKVQKILFHPLVVLGSARPLIVQPRSQFQTNPHTGCGLPNEVGWIGLCGDKGDPFEKDWSDAGNGIQN
jgi:hypothetical protein